MSGEGNEGGNFAGAREASDEEREFHAQMTNGNRDESHGQSAGHGDSGASDRPEPQREPQREPHRESQNAGSQAPLDLPPPPPTKPFVVWSSSPADAVPGPRRED